MSRSVRSRQKFQDRKFRRRAAVSAVAFALGLGAIATDARRISDGMFFAAARTIAELSPAIHDPQANLLAPLRDIRKVSFHVAVAVAKQARAERLADPMSDDAIASAVRAKARIGRVMRCWSCLDRP